MPTTHGPFDVWAPGARRLRLSLRDGRGATSSGQAVADAIVDMHQTDGGWWTPSGPTPDPTKGDVDYGYLIDDSDAPRPDPRSRRQPAGVHQRSRTYDPSSFAWTDARWSGRQLAGAVVYELHVGTFTPEGTLDAALGRLDHLLSSLELLGSSRYAHVELDAQLGAARVHVIRRTRTLAGTPGELLSLHALHGAATGVTTEGLEYPLACETLEPGSSRGVSNVFAAPEARVALESGVLLAVRPGVEA